MAEITLQELALQFGDLKKDYTELMQQNTELVEQNAKLMQELSQLAAKEVAAKGADAELQIPTEPIEYKSEKYRITAAGYRRAGEEGSAIVTAAEIAADPKLIKEILDIKGQGLLVKLA